MGTEIHATAVVSDRASIGVNCRVGPYCLIGPNVVLGDDCVLQSHVVLDGHTTLGARCEIFPFACIGKITQDLKYQGGTTYVRIGSDCTFREYVTVNAATADGDKTIIGDRCHILAYSHIAHDCRLGNGIIMSNATNLAGHVIVEDNVVFGGMVGVHQFTRIGEGSMVGGTSKVVQDIIPFALVEGTPGTPVGVNRVGLERRGYSAETIRILNGSYKILFRSGFRLEEALVALRKEYPDVPEVAKIVAFAEKSERGLARRREMPRD